jgi:hypothetical protein
MAKKRIILFGAGEAGQDVLKKMRNQERFHLLFCVDNNTKKQGKYFWGLEIRHPSSILREQFDEVIIASEYRSEILYQLTTELGVPLEKIGLTPDINDFSDPTLIDTTLFPNSALKFMQQDFLKYGEPQIIEQMENLFSIPLPYEYWLHLYFKLSRCGKLSASYCAKTQAQVIELSRPNLLTQRDVLTRFMTLAEKGQMMEAEQTLIESGLFNPRSRLSNEILGNAWCIHGNLEKAECHWSEMMNGPNDSFFSNLVKNKRVAVVGAADSDSGNGEEIDSFDLVIRTNSFHQGRHGELEKKYGKKTSISYCNTALYLDHKERYLDTLRAAEKEGIVICAMSEVHQDIRRKNLSLFSREFFRPPGVYRGTVFMVTSAVMDIMKYHPSAIKVFASDFFTGPRTHRQGYLHYENYNHLIILDDPVRNIEYARKVFAASAVETDAVLKSVLAYSQEEFISRFTGNHYNSHDE